MPTLREYFLKEAPEYLARLDELAASPAPAGEELLRSARSLRGAAQMAREERVRRVASALEVAAREVARGARPWNDDTRQRVRDSVADLRALADAGEGDAAVASRAEQALARWREVGVSPEDAAPQPTAGAGAGSDDEMRRYVVSEGRGVIAELERAIPALTRSPMGRDPLKSILRRQRALLGSAGLERYPVVAGALQAVEDATRTIARQNVAVEGDWLALYRQAHASLNESIARIEAGGAADPSSPPFVELSALRDRLIAARRDETPFQPPAAPAGDAAELVGFFRTEAGKLLDRVERMAGAFAAATDERRTSLRHELGEALSALRDTSRTFGFEEPARAAEQALGRLAEAASTTLLGTVERLREIIHAATEDPIAGAQPARGPAPARVAAPHAAAAPVAPPIAPAAAAHGPPSDADVVPIESLLYRGDAALRRAHELRAQLERAVPASDRAARESLDELFDLVRLATS
ncbi:MAG TPA: Hpt domain-containing protein [Longimicrobiales bacterium]